jgi:integrase
LRQVLEPVEGTRQDAQKELTRLMSAADAGTLPDPSNATVAEYLRSWLGSAHEQSPKTLERYRELAERQVIPHLGAIKLQRLTPENLRQWHHALLGGGLAARTVGHAHRLLCTVLATATANGTIARNVAEGRG